MADKTPQDLFTEAFDSLQNVVRNEITLIDLDADLRAKRDGLSDEARQGFADNEKNLLFRLLRTQMVNTISKLASARSSGWRRVKLTRAEQFEKHASDLRKAAGEEARTNGARTTEEDPEGLEFACPPGYIKVGGVCQPI